MRWRHQLTQNPFWQMTKYRTDHFQIFLENSVLYNWVTVVLYLNNKAIKILVKIMLALFEFNCKAPFDPAAERGRWDAKILTPAPLETATAVKCNDYPTYSRWAITSLPTTILCSLQFKLTYNPVKTDYLNRRKKLLKKNYSNYHNAVEDSDWIRNWLMGHFTKIW